MESSHAVDIEKFGRRPRSMIVIVTRRLTSHPEEKVGQEAFAVIRDAMKEKKMVGIARVVMARRERIMMIEPFGQGHHGHAAALSL